MADKDSTISKELLHELFEYRDGQLYCKKWRRNLKVGEKVGSKDKKGYLYTKINSIPFSIHRLIFLMHYGYLPKEVDHIDGDRLNNSIDNLRASDSTTNQWNSKIRADNKSGVKGVCFDKSKNRWCARVAVNGKRFNVGYFYSLEDAEKSIKKFREENHGEFTNHGCY